MTVRPTKVPGIGKLPPSLDPQTRQIIESIIEAVEIRLGRKGDPIDRAITLRELIDSGLATQLKTTPFDPNNGAGNTGFAPLGPIPTMPYAPVNFTANGAYSVINLFWGGAFYKGHNQAEIWSHTSDTLGDATLAAVSPGISFSDPVGSGVTRYYWIRFVNTAGVPGPWNSGSGTVASTATDVAHQIAVLSNAITSSELATSLNTQLSTYQTLVDVNGNITGRGYQSLADVNGNITGRGYQAASQVAATVSTAVAGVRGKIPTWVASGTYAVNEVVRDAGGKLYVCLIAVTAGTSDTLPTTFAAPTTNWKLYGDIARTEDSASKITQLNLLDGNSSSASAQSIHGLNSILKDSDGNAVVSSTNLSTMKTSVLNANGTARATAAQIDYLSSSYTNPTTGVADNVTLQQALNTSAGSVNGLNAQYSVKIDNKGHITGFGLSSTDTDAGPTSAFIVRADRFAVIDPASTADGIAADGTGTVTPTAANVPFFIDSGVTYIKEAAIKDASITNAKIGTIGADKITTGFLNADRLDAGTIGVNKLNLVGVGATINLASANTGGRMHLQGDKISVYDSSNTLRVRLGNLA